MAARRRILLGTGAVAVATATGVMTALPAGAAGFVPPKPAPSSPPATGTPKPSCSTDIIGRGAGDYANRTLTFSYTVDGPSCRDGLYALIIRNTYDPKQWAVFVQAGNGKNTELVFNQRLPFKPTGNPDPEALPVEGPGLCVIGVTVRNFRIDDIAPDPAEAPCEPLRGGGARAFH